MFKLLDGREELFQWDLNRKIIVPDPTIDEVHFCNKTGDCSLVVAVYEENGLLLADIPNILLQTNWPIKVYGYCGECYTKIAGTFKINARTRPDDYVYTETQVKRWDELAQDIEDKTNQYEYLANEMQDFLATSDEIIDTLEMADSHEKRITQLERHISQDYFATDAAVAYEKSVPAEACPYAEIDEVGGMTYEGEEIIAGAVLAGPYEFVEGAGMSEGANYGAVIPATFQPEGNFDCGVYLKNTSSETVTVMLYGLAGAFTIKNLVVPADGKFHLFTGTGRMGYNPGMDWAIVVRSNDYALIDCIEMGTLTIYEEGEAPVATNVLKHAAVTEIESASCNILDLTPALNECLRDNGDGTYTMMRNNTSSQRFSGTTPFVVKKGQVMFCQFEIVDTNIDGRNTLALQSISDDGKTPVSGVSFGLVNGGEYYTAQADGTRYVRFYIGADQPVGAYITFRNPMIQFVEYYKAPVKPYVPYIKRTYPISTEVQALEGYGMGISADFHNYIDWEKKQFVQKVGMVDMGDLTYNYRTSNGRNIFGTAALRQTIRGFVAGDAPLPAVAVGYRAVRVADTWKDGDMAYGSTTIGYTSIEFVNNAYTDVESFKAAMKGRYLVYALASPIITDVSDILPTDNLIEVEGGGTVTMVNEFEKDVPSSITYLLKEGSL